MDLPLEKRRELRELGWSVISKRGKRPAAIPSMCVLRLGEHVTVTEQSQQDSLIELENNR